MVGEQRRQLLRRPAGRGSAPAPAPCAAAPASAPAAAPYVPRRPCSTARSSVPKKPTRRSPARAHPDARAHRSATMTAARRRSRTGAAPGERDDQAEQQNEASRQQRGAARRARGGRGAASGPGRRTAGDVVVARTRGRPSGRAGARLSSLTSTLDGLCSVRLSEHTAAPARCGAPEQGRAPVTRLDSAVTGRVQVRPGIWNGGARGRRQSVLRWQRSPSAAGWPRCERVWTCGGLGPGEPALRGNTDDAGVAESPRVRKVGAEMAKEARSQATRHGALGRTPGDETLRPKAQLPQRCDRRAGQAQRRRLRRAVRRPGVHRGRAVPRRARRKDPERSEGLINYLMRDRHGSPFEHNSMTFFISAPIFVFREFMRHRVGWSYNEESGRYRELRAGVLRARRGPQAGPAGPPGQVRVRRGHRRSSTSSTGRAMEDVVPPGVRGVPGDAGRRRGPRGGPRGAAGRALLLDVRDVQRPLADALPRPAHPARAGEVSRPSRSGRSRWSGERWRQHWAQLMPLTHAAFNANGRVAP